MSCFPGSPRILLKANPSNEVTEGDDVTLTCGAHGHPSPKVTWQKQGGFLPGGLMETDTPILRLTPVRTSDEGAFVCTATNGIAPDRRNSIYLKVKGQLNVPIRMMCAKFGRV